MSEFLKAPKPVTENAEQAFESILLGIGSWLSFFMAIVFFISTFADKLSFSPGWYQVFPLVILAGLGVLFLILGKKCVHLDEQLKSKKTAQ